MIHKPNYNTQDGIKYSVRVKDGDSEIVKHGLSYESVLKIISKASKISMITGKEIDVKSWISNQRNECPCKFHLGCLTPEQCKK